MQYVAKTYNQIALDFAADRLDFAPILVLCLLLEQVVLSQHGITNRSLSILQLVQLGLFESIELRCLVSGTFLTK